MMSEEELSAEKEYLDDTYVEIQKQKFDLQMMEEHLKDLFKEQLEYAVDSHYDMDPEEFTSEKELIEQQDIQIGKIEEAIKQRDLLSKSAYFGRIDFNNAAYYIGVASLIGSDNEKLYISDWRAPISSLYYDYELGDASYRVAEGEICGEITKKRQYKVDNHKLIYAFDSNLTIGDDILKQTLSTEATQKMKNIVATIQKEQNKIIREPINKNLVIQGEAGSGKTSIALHRSAYLMYKRAGRLLANDIMILSPNNLFSEYISDVLPELGEKNIIQSTFNTLAAGELPHIKLLSRERTIERAINKEGNVSWKFAFDFKDKLDKFLEKFSDSNFIAQDIKIGSKKIEKEKIAELYNEKYKSKKISIKLGWIADYIMEELDLPRELYERVLNVAYNMVTNKNLLEIYQEFLLENGEEFNAEKHELAFEDVPAVLYIKDYILGLKSRETIKYLIVDEMQDYSPLHYEILNKLFDCNKLILGDIHQNVLEVYNEDFLEKLCELIGGCELVKLTKSYRSTYEISKYCQEIKGIDYDVIDRHGKMVQKIPYKNSKAMIEKIKEIAKCTQHKKIAIVCKDNKESEEIATELKEFTLSNDVVELVDKTIISSMKAKGIEFDVVIIPNVGQYISKEEKNILYISATRALHELYVLQAEKN